MTRTKFLVRETQERGRQARVVLVGRIVVAIPRLPLFVSKNGKGNPTLIESIAHAPVYEIS